jgi:branched-chain amino acid transport system substrate-binding protein
LQTQFHDIKGNDVEQFRKLTAQSVLTPSEYKSGDVIYPYEKAHQ